MKLSPEVKTILQLTLVLLALVAVITAVIGSAHAATDWQSPNLGPCENRRDNVLIVRMGAVGKTAVCPEWEAARKEWNVKRDRPSIPIPMTEWRDRISSTERR